MALVPDQKFSTFQNGGTPTTGDIIVGLRAGINTKFNWVLPSTVDSITGTADRVLVNGGSGVPETGDVTLSTPQDIATTSSPTFAGLTLTSPLTVANGGTGHATLTAYTLLAGGTTSTGNLQQVTAGSSGQVLQSNGSSALPSWITLSSVGVTSITGTANQVLANATSATPQVGAVTLTTPQDIATTSSPTFAALTLTSPLTGANGGTGVNNGTKTITLGGNLTTSGAFDSTFTMTGATSVTFPTSGTLATTGQLPTPAALTKVDDTNVTLTLGGTPATSLLQAVSITAGWTGTLSGTRGGTGVNNGASTFTMGGSVAFSGAFTFTGTLTGNTSVTFPTSGTLATVGGSVVSLQGTANQVLVNGTSGSPVSGTAITLTTPQDIATSSSPTFAGLNVQSSSATTGINITSTAATNGRPNIFFNRNTSDVVGIIQAGLTSGFSVGGDYLCIYGVPAAGGIILRDGSLGTLTLASGNVSLSGAIAATTSITFTSTSGIIGTTTNNNAAAGSVGELFQAVIPNGSAISVTNVTIFDLASFTLQPGDYDMWANIVFVSASGLTTFNVGQAWTSSTSMTAVDPSITSYLTLSPSTVMSSNISLNTVPQRVTISSPTNYYVSGIAAFATAALTACGGIYARRRR